MNFTKKSIIITLYIACFFTVLQSCKKVKIAKEETLHNTEKNVDTSFYSTKKIEAIKKAMQMENIDEMYVNMDTYFPSSWLKKAENPFLFYKTKNIELPAKFNFNGTDFKTKKYIDSSYTQGLLVIKNDTIKYENYWLGQKENSPHISWSMSKSYISALFGIAISEGYIKNINQTVDEYLPQVKGSAYEGIKIKDVLQMATGVKFDETYSDPNSDINRYWNGFISGKSQDEFITTLVKEKTAGIQNHYVSINTHVLGMIIVKATGKSLTTYLQEKIWTPLGSEFDSYWITDGKGMEMALGGFNATLRDYAKLGRLYLNKGNWNGTQIIPEKWINSSNNITENYLKPTIQNGVPISMGYGYQWWIPESTEGEFMAVGVFNQHIYVNPTKNVVIVKNSANKNYYDGNNPFGQTLVHLELYRKIANNISS